MENPRQMPSDRSLRQVTGYKPLAQCGMEELAAHINSLNAKGGVKFARKRGGDEKRAARQRVVDLFRCDVWNRPLRMMTMPGVGWRFERLVLGMRNPGWLRQTNPSGTHFMGVESDRAIYFAGLTQMPGTETPKRSINLVKRERYPFAELAVKTRYASYFFANMDDVLDHEFVSKAEYASPPGWDAVWLDYTGPMTVDRLAKIQRFYDKYVHDVLIVTALKARWNRPTSAAINKAGGHSEWLRQSFGGNVLHDIEYFDTSPMAQFAIGKKTMAVAETVAA